MYAITDPKLTPSTTLVAKVTAALQGGCRIVQYRNKNAILAQKHADIISLRDLCSHYQALLIINDELELALSCGADGVHLGQEDLSIAAARARSPSDFIIGATCHDSIPLGLTAQKNGADYFAFGRFFPSQTKTNAPPANPSIITMAKQQFTLPVVAIGGITVDNAASLIAHGADCVAVCHDLFQHENVANIRQTAEQYCHIFNR